MLLEEGSTIISNDFSARPQSHIMYINFKLPRRPGFPRDGIEIEEYYYINDLPVYTKSGSWQMIQPKKIVRRSTIYRKKKNITKTNKAFSRIYRKKKNITKTNKAFGLHKLWGK